MGREEPGRRVDEARPDEMLQTLREARRMLNGARVEVTLALQALDKFLERYTIERTV